MSYPPIRARSIREKRDTSGDTPAFLAAYRKGYQARLDGKSEKSCPYKDHRTWYGGITFSRAFIHRWEDGWYDAHRELTKHHDPADASF